MLLSPCDRVYPKKNYSAEQSTWGSNFKNDEFSNSNPFRHTHIPSEIHSKGVQNVRNETALYIAHYTVGKRQKFLNKIKGIKFQNSNSFFTTHSYTSYYILKYLANVNDDKLLSMLSKMQKKICFINKFRKIHKYFTKIPGKSLNRIFWEYNSKIRYTYTDT